MKILIVDDAKETRESLHDIIKVKINSAYEIAEAEDGLEALGIVESFQPDIVLTDILMPKMDGIRFTALLKSQSETKHIFIAAITGLSGEEQIQKIYASGVDFYIAKPFQLDDIVARLKVITSLITHKSLIPDAKPAVIYNCFKDEHIKHYYVTFSITKEDDIFLIFDYFSNQDVTYNSMLLKDFMVTLIKTYRRMDRKNRVFDLIIEESESFIYITVRDKSFMQAIEQLVDKHSTLLDFSRSTNAFSFRINIISFLDNDKQSIQPITNLYQHELMSASELMIISSDDIQIYVDELNDALFDYRTLCSDDNTYNESLHLTLTNLFDQYARLFKKVPEFDRVSIALQSIVIIINDNKTKKFSKADNTQVIRHLEELNITIEGWIRDVIINQSSSDIHYSDHKIMNNCRVIEKDFS